MKIVDLYPKDICVTMELSLKEIGKILTFLEKATMKFDSKNTQETEAAEFVKNQFFQLLDRVYEENKAHVS